MKKFIYSAVCLIFIIGTGAAFAADIVPDVIMMPGSQPGEVTLEDPGRCLNCHKNYELNPRVEPGFGWMGAAMGNAGRDPIFWATLAIAEQDFDGAGDLCIRCHSSGGWIGGRSTPTDGSGLRASDENGIDCDTCHQMTDPEMTVVDPVTVTPIIGTMTDPFINNSADSLVYVPGLEGYYGSGMYALSNAYGKLGPYNVGDAVARHQFTGSDFHRDVDFCGTCHDVSNSAVGQLAPNAGAQPGAPAVTRSAEVGYPLNPNLTPNDPAVLDGMAAFNNPPYAYGIVERTYSEYKSSPLSSLRVKDFVTLPADLQDTRGSLYAAYEDATINNPPDGDYVDGDLRYFSCQTCHMRPITGRGCDKANAPNRPDQPMHDQTGGNYWVYPLVYWQDQQGTLRLGGGLSAEQIEAMNDGMLRAGQHLTQAATLDVDGNIARITNMTGHKLISGYPEGRRMWLNIKFYDSQDNMIEEIGEWGPLPVPNPITNPVDSTTFVPWSIVDIDNPKLKVYEVHPAMTQKWAAALIGIGYPSTMPLSFDRLTGDVNYTLGQLAGQAPGTYHETFHFVLNNHVAFDNRIPPYQMSYDEAQKRNALPVPANQYGGSPRGVYQHWDEYDVKAAAPSHAVRADLTLYYQGTSWEYVQFLNNAVSTTATGAGAPNPVTPFLEAEGKNYLDAWVNADHNLPGGVPGTMVPPYIMATASWNDTAGCVPSPEVCTGGGDEDCDGLIDCGDPDCDADPACPSLIEWPNCFDTIDNDFDGLTDCEDRTDCDGEQDGTTTCGVGVCATTGFLECRNGAETDTCSPLQPQENNEVSCFDTLDNDCNALTDCADANCDGAIGAPTTCGVGVCEATGNLTCSNGAEVDTCTPGTPGTEGPDGDPTCTDGLDNDCDGLTDANDTDCQPAVVCSDFNNDRKGCRNAGCIYNNKTGLCTP
ncbi:MAG: hypothetical protein JSW20_03825 [Nitrospiraceae bacterium]|nr:MAG: hypothetical protein JSW20_03825 [Nitrospiraceae bacterium]